MPRLVMNHLQYEFGLVPVKIVKEDKADPIKERLYQTVLKDGALNYAEYAAIIGTSEATVKRRLGELKKESAIIRVGSNKTGHWEINKEKTYG